MTSLYYPFSTWQGTLLPPPLKDVRWTVYGLLSLYVILGLTVLGFSRKPEQVVLLIAVGSLLDVFLRGIFYGKWSFPLSAMISCTSLSILVNYSYGFQYLWIPILATVGSKYLLTYKGKHFFNPSLFGICVCILLGNEFITLAPSYQWYGSAQSAWIMGAFVLTGAVLLFVKRIHRGWLIGSFLLFFTLFTLLRAYVMRFVIPFDTLFVGALTSPAFYLFSFYMITDPATSPNDKKQQIMVGFCLALLDFLFHLKFSLYTFFFAGLTVAMTRFLYFHFKQLKTNGLSFYANDAKNWFTRFFVISSICLLVLFAFRLPQMQESKRIGQFNLRAIPEAQSGLSSAKSDILNQTDPRVAHVAKWILSVGDAAAVADVDLDGLPDVFLTQPLKTKDWRCKLHLNKGQFRFEKLAIPDLEPFLEDEKTNGLPGFAFFFDYDNDGDKDLFVGFAFGKSHLFENRMIPDKKLSFKRVEIPYLNQDNTVCLTANAFDFNKDGRLDLLIGNTLPPYLPDYGTEKVPLNPFKMPQPRYAGDRRMYHFMHESWHNANNGGENHLLLGSTNGEIFKLMPTELSKLKETRWSLAIGTADFNNDGFTDIYIANDFGRDDCYLNHKGQFFERQQGQYYGDLGLDTYKGMNTSIMDLDRNGKEDIYISNVHHAMQAEGSLLWMNHTQDNATKCNFKEQAAAKNLLNPNRFGWGAAIADLNLDGYPDVIQANGMTNDSWDKKYPKRVDYWYYQAQIARTSPEIHSYADKWADIRGCCIYEDEKDGIFMNNAGHDFLDVADKVGFTHQKNTRGVAAADFDNDGDADILVTDQYGAPQLYENTLYDKQWIGISLVGNGRTTSTDAVGTKVWVTYDVNGTSETQYREMRLVNGFMAMGDTRMLFGLGKQKVNNLKVTILWHDGQKSIFEPPALNQYHKIQESSSINN
jgi:hypothetical protein